MQKITYEDLMIGDWVIAYVDDDKHYVQVINIRENCIRFKEIGTNIIADMPYGYLYPIPITSEILRKNGFQCNQFRSQFRVDDNHILEFDKLERQLILWEEKSALKSSIFIARINYIHELQHALKLCGIDKEFEL